MGGGKWEAAETLQRQIGRFILGHRRNSNNCAVLGELGWWKLEERRDLLRLNFWGKILRLKKNRITRILYEQGRADKKEWTETTKKILEKWGIREFWEKEEVPGEGEWDLRVRKRIEEGIRKQWKEEVKQGKKLQVMRKHKKEWGKSEYLNERYGKGRRILAQLRSGASELKIESGRSEGLPREERICDLCEREVEDEEHFLLRCEKYEKERELFEERTGTKLSEENWKGKKGNNTVEFLNILTMMSKKRIRLLKIQEPKIEARRKKRKEKKKKKKKKKS